jgi:hypothetical protein
LVFFFFFITTTTAVRSNFFVFSPLVIQKNLTIKQYAICLVMARRAMPVAPRGA